VSTTSSSAVEDNPTPVRGLFVIHDQRSPAMENIQWTRPNDAFQTFSFPLDIQAKTLYIREQELMISFQPPFKRDPAASGATEEAAACKRMDSLYGVGPKPEFQQIRAALTHFRS
jgi:hypothetical protein